MKLTPKKINEALDLLKNYNGSNPYIVYLKNSIYVYKSMQLSDFNGEFILNNINYVPIKYEKVVKIADWYGKTLQDKLSLEFVP